MKKRQVLIIIILIISIINFILIINTKKPHDYYIGKIERMEKKDGITTLVVSPTESNRSFTSEIKEKHEIEYADHISIAGLKDRNKKRKDLYLGQLRETIENLIVGDSIIFKVKNYDKNNYKLEIDELAVDLTLD